MLPNMNPKQLAQMMRQFGIKTEEIAAQKVVIHKKDGSQLAISEPQIMAMDMQGQKSFQIQGKISESGASTGTETSSQTPAGSEDASASFENDVRLVMEQASVTREEAEAALKESKGDLAGAIMVAKRD